MTRLLADLGNTRLKWGRLDEAGKLIEVSSLVYDDPSTWDVAWDDCCPSDPEDSEWFVASVNRPAMARFRSFLQRRGVERASFFTSAQDVPIAHRLRMPELTGVDRALAVLAALERRETGPGQVVCCGTAITVESIDERGVWLGGSISAGLNLMARALGDGTDQLPRILPIEQPPPLGDSTRPALEAGLYWGAVGIIRELLTRQAGHSPTGAGWVILCGGDANRLASGLNLEGSEIYPDLVLEGLALLARRGGP